MKINRGTWFRVVVGLLIFGALNLHCWQPGFGFGEPTADGKRVTAFVLDLYYGWPACYCIETWHSDDESLGRKLLSKSSFFTIPDSMTLASRDVGALPAAINVAFAFAALVLLGVFGEARASRQWSPKIIFAASGLSAFLVVCYVASWLVGPYS